MKLKFKLLLGALLLLAAGVYYYVTIPAFNIHSNGFWLFVISLVVILGCASSVRKLRDGYAVKEIRLLKLTLILAGVLAATMSTADSQLPVVPHHQFQEIP